MRWGSVGLPSELLWNNPARSFVNRNGEAFSEGEPLERAHHALLGKLVPMRHIRGRNCINQLPHIPISQGLAHEAKSGWTYPTACCSGIDCREVSDKAISERPEGYVIVGTGEVLAYKDARVRDSPDGEYHWCSIGGAANTKTVCLFVPPRSY